MHIATNGAMDEGTAQLEPPVAVNRVSKQLVKTSFCKHFMRGYCRYGSNCNYAHQSQELQPKPNLFKTKLCSNFVAGWCANENCTYAHGVNDLRHDGSESSAQPQQLPFQKLSSTHAQAGQPHSPNAVGSSEFSMSGPPPVRVPPAVARTPEDFPPHAGSMSRAQYARASTMQQRGLEVHAGLQAAHGWSTSLGLAGGVGGSSPRPVPRLARAQTSQEAIGAELGARVGVSMLPSGELGDLAQALEQVAVPVAHRLAQQAAEKAVWRVLHEVLEKVRERQQMQESASSSASSQQQLQPQLRQAEEEQGSALIHSVGDDVPSKMRARAVGPREELPWTSDPPAHRSHGSRRPSNKEACAIQSQDDMPPIRGGRVVGSDRRARAIRSHDDLPRMQAAREVAPDVELALLRQAWSQRSESPSTSQDSTSPSMGNARAVRSQEELPVMRTLDHRSSADVRPYQAARAIRSQDDLPVVREARAISALGERRRQEARAVQSYDELPLIEETAELLSPELLKEASADWLQDGPSPQCDDDFGEMMPSCQGVEVWSSPPLPDPTDLGLRAVPQGHTVHDQYGRNDAGVLRGRKYRL